MPSPKYPTRVFGVDFSGSQHAGKHIWMTRGNIKSNRLVISECIRADQLPKSLANRETCFTALQSKVPFSPYNIRMYRQTFYGIVDILAPLINNNSACVLPMQEPVHGKPWLMEVCPASLLKKENHYVPYKGKGENLLQNRKRILNHFFENGKVIIEKQAIVETMMKDSFGDALDSLLAAIITFRTLNEKVHLRSANKPEYKAEGFVYS